MSKKCLNIWRKVTKVPTSPIKDDPEKYGRTRDKLIEHLKEKGIDSRLFFVGMHRQPSLLKFGCNGTGDYPITDNLAQNGFYLPSASNLKEDEIKYICDVIKGKTS